MFTDTPRIIPAARLDDLSLPTTPLEPAQVISGDPEVRTLPLHRGAGLAVGIWQHGTGCSTDVEADEVFVVLAGRATIEVDGGATLEIGPGDVGMLPAGARTTWTVHEPLRKVYLIADPG
ncbi:MAG: cupin domain-containing protein [Actinomycetales bacterium]|jgi:uncharacterized cupin superfamily protein